MRAMPLPASTSRFRVAGAARAIAIGAALIALVPAHAQGPGAQGQQASWGLGFGAGSKQKPYAGIDRDNEAIPLLEYQDKYVHVLGPAVEAKLPSLVISDTQRLDFRAVARYAIFGGYEADDAPILAGMTERKDGVWAGAKIEWKNSLANVTAEWLRDASSFSDGQRFNLVLDRSWRVGQHVMIVPRVAALWHDSKYIDYYFGVRSAEARPGRPAYGGESGVNVEVGLRSIFRFDRNHAILLDASVTGLASPIKNSPLVDRSTENRLFLAYVYRF
jgi:outer membrane protein